MRIGEIIYHSRRISEDNAVIEEYASPVEYRTALNYITVMSAATKGYVQILKYGETATDKWEVQCNGNIFAGVFKKGDLMWVDGQYPIAEIENEYGNGASANAIVKNVAYVNRGIQLLLEKNTRSVYEN